MLSCWLNHLFLLPLHINYLFLFLSSSHMSPDSFSSGTSPIIISLIVFWISGNNLGGSTMSQLLEVLNVTLLCISTWLMLRKRNPFVQCFYFERDFLGTKKSAGVLAEQPKPYTNQHTGRTWGATQRSWVVKRNQAGTEAEWRTPHGWAPGGFKPTTFWQWGDTFDHCSQILNVKLLFCSNNTERGGSSIISYAVHWCCCCFW